MDVLAHTLWTNAGARAGNKLAQKKGKKFHIHVGWTAFWGVIPDFFAFTAPFIIGLYKVIFTGVSFSGLRDHHGLVGGFDIAAYLYQYSHSLVVWAFVFCVVWYFAKRPRYELLGWALHILIDIPSHAIGFYPTPFLFPISEYRFPYGVSWGNTWYMIINYTALAFVWIPIALRKVRNKQK
jgi:hypothetical protein